MKSLLVSFALSVIVFSVRAQGQVPYINSISQPSGAIKDIINISGSHFGGVTQVYFGGAKSPNIDVKSGGNLITAEVPAGATYDAVSVVNATTHLTAYSGGLFHLTFAGEHKRGASVRFKSQKKWETNKKQAQDLSVCDFDGDGDMDVVVSNVGGNDPRTKNPAVTLFTNVTTGFDVVRFNRSLIAGTENYAPEHLTAGDLNGDGRPDLIVTEIGGGGKVFVYLNATTTADAIQFTPSTPLSLPKNQQGNFRQPGQMAIRDLDLDGKPEIVVASKGENIIFFFKNESTGGNIRFAPNPQSIEALQNAGSAGFGGLKVVDLNADEWPEIIASNVTGHGVYVLQNRSRTGNISLLPAQFFNTPANIRTLEVADMNQDALPDIIVNSSEIGSNNTIEIFQNTTDKRTPGASIAFKAPAIIKDENFRRSWGMGAGDIDGDGDIDLAIASYGRGFYLVMNNTKPKGADISPNYFEVSHVSVPENSRNIKIVDINEDGKPDVVYTNQSATDKLGNLAVSLNDNCLHPKISPAGPVVLCDGDNIDLKASNSAYVYTWKRGTTNVGANTQTLAGQNIAGDYTVSVNDRCANPSTAVRVSQSAQSIAKPVFTANDNTPCEKSNVTFTINSSTANIASYRWEGPGFTSTDPSPTLPNISSIASGEYRVTATSTGVGCQKTSDPVELRVIALPFVSVKASSNQFCGTRRLTANNVTGYNYQWQKGGNNIAGETNPDGYTANEAGDYAIVISGSGCSDVSAIRTLTKITPPTAAFSDPNPATLCRKVTSTYEAASTTSATGVTIENEWNFGYGEPRIGDKVLHRYDTVKQYTLTLKAGYKGVEGCLSSPPLTKNITIVAAPVDKNLIIAQSSTLTKYEKCRTALLTLTLKDPSKYDSIKWFFTNNSKNIVSTQPTFSVPDPSEVSARLVTKIGKCTFQATPVSVSNYEGGGITISVSGSNSITEEPQIGKVIRLNEGQASIRLSVNATSPVWQPESMIDEPKATSILVTPLLTRQLVTVQGKDRFGCDEDAKVTLLKPGVKAEESFTPNGDGINDCWKVSGIRSTDCTIVVFDHKGREVRKFSFSPNDAPANPDECVWDGNTANGSPVPEGIYYYMINCSDNAKESSGPILLAR